jgi:hypothetical protein
VGKDEGDTMNNSSTKILLLLCAVTLFIGASMLVRATMAFGTLRLIDDVLLTDNQLLERVNTGEVNCSGINIGKIAGGLLQYHEALRIQIVVFFRSSAILGVFLLTLGGAQVFSVRKLRRAITVDRPPK